MTATNTQADPATEAGEDSRYPRRAVPTRRVDFGFGQADLRRHFMNDDLVGSHVVTVLSTMFPEGEDFFVRSVRNYRERITDPELRKQVAGFIGQEAIHGREHRAFNEALGELGYPVRFLDGRVRVMLAILARTAPRTVQLAVTAALEHYTATLAEMLLSTDTLQDRTDIAEVRNLFRWHALEENEHKSVAFDVFMEVSGNETVRINVMRLVTVGFLWALTSGTVVSLATDPAARNLGRLRRSLAELRANPMLSKQMRSRIKEYNRRGFHPDDRDTTALLAQWRETLFGEQGELKEMLRSGSAA